MDVASAVNAPHAPAAELQREIHLDVIRHPYGPCPAALEAIGQYAGEQSELLAARLCRRIGETYRVPVESIRLIAGADAGIRHIVSQFSGPIVTFPPSAGANGIERASPNRPHLQIARGLGRGGTIAANIASDIPPDALAYIESPADPLGNLLSPAGAVRLSRACRWLVVDERYAEFAGQSLLALAGEFENIVVIRSFEIWAGLEQSPCAWAAFSPRAASCIEAASIRPLSDAIAAALATLDNLGSVEATLKLVREERSRLYRLLRKLSFLEPAPSWGPFLSARASVAERDEIVEQLRRRGVRVHAPDHPALDRFIRFGVGSRSDMDLLRHALLDLAPALVA